MLVGKENRKYLRDVKTIPSELQLRLIVVDVDKRKLKVVRKERTVRRKVWTFKDNETRTTFEERVSELVSVDAPDLWGSFKNGLIKACDEVCGKKTGRRDRGDT